MKSKLGEGMLEWRLYNAFRVFVNHGWIALGRQ
jgi:hypothetical protein